MKNSSIGIIGLGYVGLPLAVAFASKYQVIGFDINEQRVEMMNNHQDLRYSQGPDAASR